MKKNRIMKFISETFGSVRGYYIDGQSWLDAKDICKILKLGDVYQAVSRLDDDEKLILESNPPKTYNISRGRGKTTLVVSEAGFYSLVLTSRTPDAKEFKRWVTHEVLPTLRRTGEYNML